jgi:hypothetical protein
MKDEEIKAIGEFLRNYQTDLEYIVKFRRFMNGEISSKNYTSKEQGSFYRFLIEFRIARCIPQGSTEELLMLIKKWCSGQRSDDIDAFAQHLKINGISRGATLNSLASKVLFLNNPYSIIPMDTLARKTLKQKTICIRSIKIVLKLLEKKRNKLWILLLRSLHLSSLVLNLHSNHHYLESKQFGEIG